MTDLSRLTKAEIIELYEQSEAKKKELEEKIKLNETQIAIDMGFARTPDERSEHQKLQDEKDYIKRMTHGRWVSQEKFKQFQQEQKQRVRQ